MKLNDFIDLSDYVKIIGNIKATPPQKNEEKTHSTT